MGRLFDLLFQLKMKVENELCTIDILMYRWLVTKAFVKKQGRHLPCSNTKLSAWFLSIHLQKHTSI